MTATDSGVPKHSAAVRISKLAVDVAGDVLAPVGLGILTVELFPALSKVGIYVLASGVFLRILSKKLHSYLSDESSRE